MGYRIAIDTGGTFTDLVLADEQGNMYLGKAPTTFERIFGGIEGALGMVAEQLRMKVAAALGQTDLLIYGTTHATNAIIEGKTAKTALLVTEGFPDILVLREGGKTNPYDLSAPYPQPYIPRRLTFEIRERTDSEGEVALPLDRRQARQILEALRKRGVEAVAVCFLWSPVNPTNELAMGRLIEEELPGVPYTLSRGLDREQGQIGGYIGRIDPSHRHCPSLLPPHPQGIYQREHSERRSEDLVSHARRFSAEENKTGSTAAQWLRDVRDS